MSILHTRKPLRTCGPLLENSPICVYSHSFAAKNAGRRAQAVRRWPAIGSASISGSLLRVRISDLAMAKASGGGCPSMSRKQDRMGQNGLHFVTPAVHLD